MKKQNLDGSLLTFPQDEHIHFEESSHTYHIDGALVGEPDRVLMKPVSSVVADCFLPFDADYWSLRKADGDARRAAVLREQWECKGKMSSGLGTHLHKQIENFLCSGCDPVLEWEFAYDGRFVQQHDRHDIRREWEMFLAFHRDTVYQPFRTEWMIYDVPTRIAGTADLVTVRPDGKFELFDWKRSNRIDPKERNRWASGINGLEHLTDTTYMHYCLQQNLYRRMLETNYGLPIAAMHLVVLHPDNPGYRIVDIPRMEREVDIIMHRHQRG